MLKNVMQISNEQGPQFSGTGIRVSRTRLIVGLLILTVAVAVVVFWLLPQQQNGEEKVLNVYNWSDYVAETTISDFEQEFGIKVNYDVFDSNDILLAKMIAGNSGYDIIVPTNGALKVMIEANLIAELDKTKITNLHYTDPAVYRAIETFDPGSRYGLIYLWGTTGIGYNKQKIAERLGTIELDSWDILLDPANASKLADCGINLLDAVDEVYQPVLIAMGFDPNDPTPEQIDIVAERFQQIRPYVRHFDSSSYINDLATGEICLSIGWSGDIIQARDRAEEADNGIEIEYIIPKEGSIIWADMIAIPDDAPHPDNAHLFINYLMRPEVTAALTEYVYYPNANTGANELLDQEILSDTLVYPDAATIATLKSAGRFAPEAERYANRTWTNLKAGR